MNLLNETGLEFGWVIGSFEPPQLSAVFIVKGTFALKPNGTATLLEEQPGLEAEVFHEDRPEESLRSDSDFALFKPRADVLFAGHCHAPKGKPIDVCRVTLGLGRWSKSLAVIGNRVWKSSFLVTKMTDPEPFSKMPIRYDLGFGGLGYAKNPIGKGFTGTALPNIEAIDQLLRSPEDRRDPAGFGPFPRSWPQRWKKVGSYGRDWLQNRWPWFAKDFDWSHFNAAPEDQQLREYLRGDEELWFENLHPAHAQFRSRLPGLRPRLFEDGSRGFREVALPLDTLFVDMDQERATLVWRGRVETANWDMADLGTIFLAAETAAPSPPPHHQRTMADRLVALQEEQDEPDVRVEIDEALAQTEAEIGTFAPEGWTRERAIAHAAEKRSFAEEDLSGLDLSELDFSGLDFRGAVLSSASLFGSRWVGANLGGANLSGAYLRGADLSGSNLEGADLTGALLPRAVLAKANLSGADFSRTQLYRADLREVGAENAIFAGAELAEASLSLGNFRSADFCEAGLAYADASGADFTEAGFFGARGFRMVMRGANLTGLRAPDGASFLAADFREVRAEGSTWQGAKLSQANFSQAKLGRADFLEAELGETLFLAADLREGRFSEARARGADFSRANLLQADFRSADLTGASLFGANAFGISLWDAVVEQTDVREAKQKRNAPHKARVYNPRS